MSKVENVLGVTERFSIMYVQQSPRRKNGSETNMSKQGKASRAVGLIPANYELRAARNRFNPVHRMQQSSFFLIHHKKLKATH